VYVGPWIGARGAAKGSIWVSEGAAPGTLPLGRHAQGVTSDTAICLGGTTLSMQRSSISRAPRPSSLADVLDLILDKGLVIDAFIRVSAVGIEILTIDARIVVASVDTYLRFAEAVNRLDLAETKEATTFPEMMQGKVSEKGRDKGRQMAKSAVERIKERVSPG
jgi:gas vesicle structural protein